MKTKPTLEETINQMIEEEKLKIEKIIFINRVKKIVLKKLFKKFDKKKLNNYKRIQDYLNSLNFLKKSLGIREFYYKKDEYYLSRIKLSKINIELNICFNIEIRNHFKMINEDGYIRLTNNSEEFMTKSFSITELNKMIEDIKEPSIIDYEKLKNDLIKINSLLKDIDNELNENNILLRYLKDIKLKHHLYSKICFN